jgi:hypothetical protein
MRALIDIVVAKKVRPKCDRLRERRVDKPLRLAPTMEQTRDVEWNRLRRSI